MGYGLVATTTFNGIFVDQKHLDRDLDAPTASPDTADTAVGNGTPRPGAPRLAARRLEELHLPSVGASDIFQLYDGTLVLAGCRKLLWQPNTPIHHEAIQVSEPRELLATRAGARCWSVDQPTLLRDSRFTTVP